MSHQFARGILNGCRVYKQLIPGPHLARIPWLSGAKLCTDTGKKFANITLVIPSEKREIKVKAEIGQSFLDIIIDNNIDIDGYGACEGTLACSTCHLIFTKEDYNRILSEQRKITDDEEDMLDLAKDRTDESRLGCQVKVASWMDGHKIFVPSSSDARLG